VLFAADFLILGRHYAWGFVLSSFLGIFTDASSMALDFDSPLWYFTLILSYYLLFPLVFFRKRLWLTALALGLAGFLLTVLEPPFLSGVSRLYALHYLAFPLGVLLAWVVSTHANAVAYLKTAYLRHARYLYLPVLFLLCALIGYFAINAQVNTTIYREELVGLFITLLICLLFWLKKRESKLLSLFGAYSYEIFLFHWPILYRYDLLYKHLPAWIATALYLALFIGLGMLLERFSRFFLRHHHKKAIHSAGSKNVE
jgi:peptidoglycan/LPS O-acetylase OafA/YrhL